MSQWSKVVMIGVVGSLLLISQLMAGEKSDKWDMASQNMILALQGDNDGLKASVLQNIIRFGDSLDVQEAVYDVMSIYRSHPNEGMRQLALIALYKMKNGWALSFLERAIKFEKSPRIQKSICAILSECNRRVQIDQGLLADNAGE